MEWVCVYMMLPILFVAACLIASVVFKPDHSGDQSRFEEPYEPPPSYTDHPYFDRD